jgi:protein tyrosine kinase modulator
MGPIKTTDDLIDMLRRRARLILFVAALGSVFSLLFALSQKHVYSATEVIQIARPKIANDLAPSTVAGSSARRLQLIEQRLMTRGSLLEIVSAYNLYAEFPDLKPSEMVNRFRQSVKIEGVAAAREGYSDDGTVAVLSITAEMPSATQAQQVASELSRRTIALSVNTRIEQARETLAFFAAQEEELSAEMDALEAQIVNFRNENYLALPGSVEFRRTEVGNLNQALLLLDREIILINREAEDVKRTERLATAKRKQEDFDEQLATMSAQRKLLQDRKSDLENSLNTSPEIERKLGVYDRQARLLRGQLDVMSTRRAEADVGLRIENARQGEHLTVIEPAALPDFPITGGRKRIAILGGVLSMALGIALAFWVELNNPVIRTATQMKRELGFSPVVMIPHLDPTRPKISFWRRATAWLTGTTPKDNSVA